MQGHTIQPEATDRSAHDLGDDRCGVGGGQRREPHRVDRAGEDGGAQPRFDRTVRPMGLVGKHLQRGVHAVTVGADGNGVDLSGEVGESAVDGCGPACGVCNGGAELLDGVGTGPSRTARGPTA